MRRLAPLCCVLAAGLLGGCTGVGVFLDHTFTWFGDNPNTPAGNSEMFQRLRGESFVVAPLLPEPGNIWPGPQKPDPTMQELAAQQGTGGAPASVGGGTDHQQPRPSGPQGPAPAVVKPGPAPNLAPQAQAPGGGVVDTTGGRKLPDYKRLQPSSSAPPPAGRGILVPNGNGTSTLIGPDGSVSTVPDKP